MIGAQRYNVLKILAEDAEFAYLPLTVVIDECKKLDWDLKAVRIALRNRIARQDV